MSDSQDADRALPPVSVVLPAFNLESHIGLTIEALLAHDYPTLEIIVVDDCSTDGTAEAVRRYPVRFVQHEKNGGAAAARNTGVCAATHEIVYLLDADCIVTPGTVRRLVERLLGDLRIGVVSGGCLSDGDKKNLANKVYDVAERYRDSDSGARAYPYTTVSNTVLRRSLFDAVGGFRTDWRCIEDYEFTHRIHQAGHLVVHDSDIKVVHNNHREQLSRYYSHIYSIAEYGTLFRLINRPHVPYSRLLMPSLPLFLLMSPLYVLMHTTKIVMENVSRGRVLPLVQVLPFVVWSRVVYTAGSISGCRAFGRWKKAQGLRPRVSGTAAHLMMAAQMLAEALRLPGIVG